MEHKSAREQERELLGDHNQEFNQLTLQGFANILASAPHSSPMIFVPRLAW